MYDIQFYIICVMFLNMYHFAIVSTWHGSVRPGEVLCNVFSKMHSFTV